MVTANWYALQVRTGFELEIAENVKRYASIKNLGDFVKDVFAGVKKIVRMTEKGRKLDAEAVLTGYIFVKLDSLTGEMWHLLKNVPGVYKILDMLPISSEEIDNLHKQCAGEVEVRVEAQQSNTEHVIDELPVVETVNELDNSGQHVDALTNQQDAPGEKSMVTDSIVPLSNPVKIHESNGRIQEVLSQVVRSFFKGSKEVFRIPISFYRVVMEHDEGLRERVNERNPQYILSAIRNFAQHIMSGAWK